MQDIIDKEQFQKALENFKPSTTDNNLELAMKLIWLSELGRNIAIQFAKPKEKICFKCVVLRLVEVNLITSDEQDYLIEIFKIRNALVHSSLNLYKVASKLCDKFYLISELYQILVRVLKSSIVPKLIKDSGSYVDLERHIKECELLCKENNINRNMELF